jgi:Fe2+ transport system protein B
MTSDKKSPTWKELWMQLLEELNIAEKGALQVILVICIILLMLSVAGSIIYAQSLIVWAIVNLIGSQYDFHITLDTALGFTLALILLSGVFKSR